MFNVLIIAFMAAAAVAQFYDFSEYHDCGVSLTALSLSGIIFSY